MGVIKAGAGSKAEEIRTALVRYLADHSFSRVEFHDTTNPSNNPLEDNYVVTYEAVFEPVDLEHAYLKIFVTDCGEVGIGLETRERIARRLGVRLYRGKKAFATGRELASISVEELIHFVAIVAQGNVVLQAKIGLTGFGSVKAIVKPESAGTLKGANARQWDWLTVSAKDLKNTSRTRIVQFDPWQ